MIRVRIEENVKDSQDVKDTKAIRISKKVCFGIIF